MEDIKIYNNNAISNQEIENRVTWATRFVLASFCFYSFLIWKFTETLNKITTSLPEMNSIFSEFEFLIFIVLGVICLIMIFLIKVKSRIFSILFFVLYILSAVNNFMQEFYILLPVDLLGVIVFYKLIGACFLYQKIRSKHRKDRNRRYKEHANPNHVSDLPDLLKPMSKDENK